MAIIEPTVDHIDDETLMRELRNLAGAVDKNETALNNELEQLSDRQDQVDESIAGFQSQIDANKSAIENEVVARQNADDSETEARQQADITGASLSIVSGAIQLMLNRALGAINANVTAPFIKTMELIPTTTDRAFKVRITYWDNTQYDTNDFVIPAGGGTDVSVTGVTIQDGTTPNSFQVQIELSDGTPISSNDYSFPEAVVNPYPTSVTVGLSGTTLSVSVGLSNSTSVSGNVDLAPILANYITDTELTQVQSDLQEQISGLKLSTDGNNMTLNGDSVQIVKSVSGQVTDGNLKITINGVQSGDIPLPESESVVINTEINVTPKSSWKASSNSGYDMIGFSKIENCNLISNTISLKSNLLYVPTYNIYKNRFTRVYYEGIDLSWTDDNLINLDDGDYDIYYAIINVDDGINVQGVSARTTFTKTGNTMRYKSLQLKALNNAGPYIMHIYGIKKL